ncbi:hypothetical protein RLEG12_09510 (plasmid) [Rhizobium leguminosarum bv. trifolii CB782]|nr:hypothetical protein RLEG12_09510 [Rhizobium leguminosarum bv. trifolii CB782]
MTHATATPKVHKIAVIQRAILMMVPISPE